MEKKNSKKDMLVMGAAILGAATSIPRVRHFIGEVMVGLNENLGIPKVRADIDQDTPESSDEGTTV